MRSSNTQAQIKFVESVGNDESDFIRTEKRNVSPPEIFSGEVYDTSIRLRETGALGMVISLSVFGEVSRRGSVPSNLETIWDFIDKKKNDAARFAI